MHRPKNVVEVPHFLQDCTVLSTTAEVWDRSSLCRKGILNLAQAVGCLVRGENARTFMMGERGCWRRLDRHLRGQHIPGRVLLEGADHREVEVDDVLVFYIVRAITGHIVRRCASRMLGEL